MVEPGADTAVPFIPRPHAHYWVPPSGVVHRLSMTETIGGWRDYRELRVAPETDLCRRAHAAGARFVFVPRLTAIKFSAAVRRNVYRERPCHEQAQWLRRIEAEPQLEATQLVHMITSGGVAQAMCGRELLRQLLRRVRLRFSPRSGLFALHWPKKGTNIDAVRTYKGL
jgi:GT2 family glycosyltransferase